MRGRRPSSFRLFFGVQGASQFLFGQKVGTERAGQNQRFPFPPGVHLFMISRNQHFGHAKPHKFLRAGVLRVFQPPPGMALVFQRIGADDPLDVARNRVGHHHGGQFAARQNVVADGKFFVHGQVDGALIHPLVMPAKKQKPGVCGVFFDVFLPEHSAFRRKVNAARFVIGVHRVHTGNHRLGRHQHAGAAAEGVIVALFVLVSRIVADIPYADIQNARFRRAL